jgi:hypothetical protein
VAEYDDDRELTRYVWDHYQRLMSDFEWRVGRAIFHRAKFGTAGHPEAATAAHRRWCEVGVPEVEAALLDGPEVFRRRVRDRLLSERGSELFVNRCPRCSRVVRTPQARQCFWCGCDWHSQSAEQAAAADRPRD